MAQRQRQRLPPAPELGAEGREALRRAGEFAQQRRAEHAEEGLQQLASFTGGGFDALATALEQNGLAAPTLTICTSLRSIASGGDVGSSSFKVLR